MDELLKQTEGLEQALRDFQIANHVLFEQFEVVRNAYINSSTRPLRTLRILNDCRIYAGFAGGEK